MRANALVEHIDMYVEHKHTYTEKHKGICSNFSDKGPIHDSCGMWQLDTLDVSRYMNCVLLKLFLRGLD